MKTTDLSSAPGAAEEARIGQRAHAALEAAAAALPPDIAFRLRQSRELALTRHAPRRSPVALLQLAGFPGAGSGNWMRDIIAPAIGIVMLALLATAASQYSQAENHNDTVDIDSSLLIDDLPIDAYLDRGFGAWLDQGNP